GVCRKRPARAIGLAIHVEVEFARNLIADADDVMPDIELRADGAVGVSVAGACGVADKEAERLVGPAAIEVELFATRAGAFGYDASVVRLLVNGTHDPAFNRES